MELSIDGTKMQVTGRTLALAFWVAICASSAAAAQDYGDNEYHFSNGSRLNEAPRSGYAIDHDLTHYWYDRGHWYRRDDLGWVVVDAPVGAFISVLPPDYTTVWSAGASYYYADDAYYRWNGAQRAYEVVPPPAQIGSAGATQASAGAAIFAYARNGQSPRQQARDRDECHRLAVEQAGGDVPPEVAASQPDNTVRAEAACLDARGYGVW